MIEREIKCKLELVAHPRIVNCRHIADLAGTPEIILPVPAFNVINGGSHAGNKLAMQEFMILPTGNSDGVRRSLRRDGRSLVFRLLFQVLPLSLRLCEWDRRRTTT